MKKGIMTLIVVMLVLTACSEAAVEGVTLTKENYDALIATQLEAQTEIEGLKSEVEYLEKRLEDLTGKPVDGTSSTTESQASQASTESTESSESTETTTQVEEAGPSDQGETLEEGAYSSAEISAMTLSLYEDDYGYYGYENASGEIIIEADFDTATAFVDGLARVTSAGKKGTINSGGLISWTSVDTYSSQEVKPRNDVTEDSSFGKFLSDYREALENRDQAYVKAHTHPNVKISFGGHSGWDGLVSYWSLADGSEGFYRMMKTTLQYGAVDTSGGQGNSYSAPYVFTDFPDDLDPYTFGVVVGSGVNLRTRPTTDAEIIGKASYEVLKVIEPETDDWVKVQLADGTRAYIYGTYLWSPIGYRAKFTKVDNTWLLESFVKGD